MPSSARYSRAWMQEGLNARARLLNGGELRIYLGPRPGSPDDAAPASSLLAALRLGTPAFEEADGEGAITTRRIEQESNAPRRGQATWFRMVTSRGKTMMEGSVGESDADLILDDVQIRQGAVVAIASVRHIERG